MVAIELLKQVEVFQSLSDDELSAIGKLTTENQFAYGDRLFKDGDSATHLWIVEEGIIDLRFDLPGRETSEESTLSTISANKIIGWSSLVPPYKYKLSAYCASSRCRVQVIDREPLREFLTKHPKTGYQVMSAMLRVVGRRFQRLQGASDDAPLAPVKVTVHLGTCGIAAGARDVMKAAIEAASGPGHERIAVTSSGCLGKCATEPNVTVEIQNQGAVVYQKMNPEKMRRVLDEHIVNGRVLNDWVLEGGNI
ncbi:MAG: cyclic nucleotide-binding domain-containing protein [Desulfobacteraceae bacterium]|nr:cyclic nucleotide-binding domain-containing protein [Desulfobacteraceae bacterium]MBC2753981.1 cyclic nucleotide-binding domain-containing protein [Desulfobacteraceae bacterium]